MKRKRVSLILAGILAVSMVAVAGCGAPESEAAGGSAAEPSVSTEEEAAPETEGPVSEAKGPGSEEGPGPGEGPGSGPAQGEAVNVDSTLSFDDAVATELTVSVDGTETKVTMYEDCYVTNPTNVAMIPNVEGVDQKISVYVPENATADSPIIFSVNNAGWIMDAYNARTQVEDGKSYVSTSDDDMIGMALSRGYVIVSHGARSRGDNATTDGKYVSHSPATMTDTKAAIRYLRNNADKLPAGDPEKIVITGTSGGGALSTIISSSGNSEDYFESLYEIGAAGIEKNDDGTYTSTISDAVFATIAYCPINDLREADAAYEWTYRETRQRLVDEGLPSVDESTGETFQDPFNDVYTTEWMMTASAALSDRYSEYVNSLSLTKEDGSALTSDNLAQGIIDLLNKEFAKTAEEIGTEQMLADLAGNADYSGQNTTGVYNSSSEGWKDFLTMDDDGVPYIADEEALQEFFYFVARNQTLKVACAFSNAGVIEGGLASVSGFNEDSLFGTEEYPYSAYEFYSWDNDSVKGNGCGLDDTGLTWDEFMETEEGQAFALQMQMASPIPYLTSTENGESAAHWYVRHGVRDRDTSFALQTVLYYALSNDESIEDLDFGFAWLQPHAGDYDVQEAYAWLESILS